MVEDGRLHIFAGASCIGQGLGTVLTQMVYEQTGIPRDRIVYERSNTYCAPDSGTTSGSRQTLFTGEAVRRACQDLKEAMGASGGLDALNGQEFYGEYLGKTDPLGAPVPNPVSHVAYGYATQVCILDDEGKIRQMVAAHDVGKAVNPLSIEGQIEGGVVMSMGFALTERYPLTDWQAHRQIRHAGPVPGQPDPGDHPHHRGKSGTERGLRRHRYRRDHLHPHSPSHCGRLLPLRRQVPYQSAPGGHALQP